MNCEMNVTCPILVGTSNFPCLVSINISFVENEEVIDEELGALLYIVAMIRWLSIASGFSFLTKV